MVGDKGIIGISRLKKPADLGGVTTRSMVHIQDTLELQISSIFLCLATVLYVNDILCSIAFP